MLRPIPLLQFAVSFSILLAWPLAAQTWTPEEWESGSTLRFATVGPDRQEQWSTAWYVVLYGDVYLRLGTAAAHRMEANLKAPYVQVKIGNQYFADVRADSAEGMTRTVNEAMAEKYTLDILFRYLPHPMTVRLRQASR